MSGLLFSLYTCNTLSFCATLQITLSQATLACNILYLYPFTLLSPVIFFASNSNFHENAFSFLPQLC